MYTTSTQISNYLGRDLTQYEADQLTVLIATVKRWIDTRLSSTFDEASASSRYYDGDYQSLSIDPCKTITSVELIDNYGNSVYTYQTSDYKLLPANQTIKREIFLYGGKFPCGVGNIKVTATFSEYDSGVPEDIQTLATCLVGNIFREQSAGGLESENIEGHSYKYDTATLSKIAESDGLAAMIIDSRNRPFI